MDGFTPLRAWGKSKHRVYFVEHYYRMDEFYLILDMQMQELNSRFTEANTLLLLGMACLNPLNSFSNFDQDKILRLAQLYLDNLMN